MPQTVTTVDVIPAQTFKITVNGLSVHTILSVYFDNQLVGSENLSQISTSVDSVSSSISTANNIVTDSNGSAKFNFTLPQKYTDVINKTEAQAYDALTRDSGVKTVVVVDAASISSNTLPTDFRTVARCYAETVIRKSVQVTFNDVTDRSTPHVSQQGRNTGRENH